MQFILYFLPALLSAGLLAIAIPNEWLYFGSSIVGLIAIVPVYIGFSRVPNRRTAAVLNGCMVAFVHLFASFWLAFFKDFAIFTLGASTLAYFVLALPFGVFFFEALKMPKSVRAFVFAAIWVLWEWFKSTGFLAYPWGTVFMSSMQLHSLIQIADITGVLGITFIMVLVSAVLAEFILQSSTYESTPTHNNPQELYRLARLSIVLIMCVTLYGGLRLAQPMEAIDYLNVGIVQQNADSWEAQAFDTQLEEMQTRTKKLISTAEKKPDIILWGEGTLHVPYEEYYDFYQQNPFSQSFNDFLREIDIPLLAGSPVALPTTPQRYNNAVRLFSANNEHPDSYAKIQLVCFAEYIPLIDHPLVARFFDSIVGFSNGWQPGTRLKTLRIQKKDGSSIDFAAPICFEDAFPTLCADLHNQGSQVLINLTNDAWSRTLSAEYQHFVVAHFRAIELRTTLIRSTNAGYSAIVDPKGRILADLPLFSTEELFYTVPIYKHTETVYAKYKDWFPKLLLLILTLLCAKQYLSRKKAHRLTDYEN